MTLDSIVITVVFIALVAWLTLWFALDLWRESRFREPALDWCADALTWCRTWTWRKFELYVGQVIVSIGCRIMQHAQRPEIESADRIRTRFLIGRHWESRDLVVERQRNVLRVQFGGRRLSVKV